VIFGGVRVWLAFEPTGVCAVRMASSWRSARVQAFRRVALPAGALEPSTAGPVLIDVEVVRAAAATALAEIGATDGRLRVLVPDGLARLVLLEVPPAGVAEAEFARFRLGPGLQFPVSEAIVGVLRLPQRRSIAAALRRSAVEAFESLVRGIGAEPAGVHLASLAALAALLASAPPNGVAALLGETTLTLAAFKSGRLVTLRQRLRDAGDEPARLVAEVGRTATLAGLEAGVLITLAGRGARLLHHALVILGHPAQLLDLRVDGAPELAEELAWLKGLAA
jgi:hypothetical protein